VIKLFNGKYKFLDGDYEVPVIYNGLLYGNSESAYQSSKCKNSKHKEAFTLVRGDMAKLLGRHVEIIDNWEDIKMDIMYGVISWAGKSTILILVGILGIMALLSLPNRIYMVAVGYYIAHVFDALKSVVYANEINRNTTISNRGTVTSFLFLVEGILISVVMVIVGKLHGVCGTVSLFKMILMFISIVLVPVTVKYIRANQEKVRMS